MRNFIISIILAAFLANTLVPGACAQALMPRPGEMVPLSPAFAPPLLKGVKVYPQEPFRLDFILDRGTPAGDSERLIKYFLAALTVPRQDLWVNLSPYEKERIVPEGLGQTGMGRDLLAQDYLLKQITASVIYPEGETGKKFWAEVYRQAQEKYGTTDIPVDTFNKVWIVPAKAAVFEGNPSTGSGQGDAAFVIDSRLKVMLEIDYLASKRGDIKSPPTTQGNSTTSVGADLVSARDEIARKVLRSVIIPILEKEVNEGRHFAPLRQVYHALILATWYKRKISASLLSKVYVDQKKVDGVNIADPKEVEKIWARYVETFRTGVFNFIREERDGNNGEMVPRKYFSGGVNPDPAELLRVSTIASELPDNAGSLEIDQVRLRGVAAKGLMPFLSASERFGSMREDASMSPEEVKPEKWPTRDGFAGGPVSNTDLFEYFATHVDKLTGRWELGNIGQYAVSLKMEEMKNRPGWVVVRLFIHGNHVGDFHVSMDDGYLQIKTFEPYYLIHKKNYERRGVADLVIRSMAVMARRLGVRMANTSTKNVQLVHLYRKYFADRVFIGLNNPSGNDGVSRDLGEMIDDLGFFASGIWGSLYIVATQQDANNNDEGAVRLEKYTEKEDQYKVTTAMPHARFVAGDILKIVAGSVSVWNKELSQWEETSLSVFGGALTNKLSVEGDPTVDEAQAGAPDKAEQLFPDHFRIVDEDDHGRIVKKRNYEFEATLLGMDMVRQWRKEVDKPGVSLVKVVDGRPVEAAVGKNNAEHPFGVLLSDADTKEPLGIAWWQWVEYGSFKIQIRQLFGFQFKHDVDPKARKALMARVLSDMIRRDGPARGDLFAVQPSAQYRSLFEEKLFARVDGGSIRYGMGEEDRLIAAFYFVDLARARDYINKVLQSFDAAQESAAVSDKAETGGIDLDPVDETLRVDNAGQSDGFNIDPAMLDEYSKASGLVPVIVNVLPVNDLPTFLGIKK